jgi:enoyl-CoA hydratase
MTSSTSPSVETFVSDVLAIEVDGHVATLWLDRPDKRNALGPAFWSGLPLAIAAIEADPDIRVIVLAAKGPHFSVGLDLVETTGLLGSTGAPGTGTPSAETRDVGTDADRDDPPPSVATRTRDRRAEIVRLQASVSSLSNCRLPVIAALHGYCIGGGVDLAAACDIRMASADCLLSIRETRMAMVADLGSLQRLPHIIGQGHLAELAYTGKDITAARAEAIGLVNHVAADAEAVLIAARALATDIAANSPLAVQGAKAVLAAGQQRSVAEGLDYVATWAAGSMASDDLAEAITAFLEKRPPRFTGH